MGQPSKQIWRLIRLVDALKRQQPLTSRSFAARLRALGHVIAEDRGVAVCSKTVQRDIACLRTDYRAPIMYDSAQHTYVLVDPNWTFPFLRLDGDELFAALLSGHITSQMLPPLRETLESVMAIQLAAGDPERLSPDLLESLISATGAAPPLDLGVFQHVLHGWRGCRRIRVLYAAAGEATGGPRDVDIHALFLSDHAWYARVYCHLRCGFRSLALHRIRHAEPLAESFERSATVVAEVGGGQVFDYEPALDVVLRCTPEKAGVIAERDWFPGQRCRYLPDQSLEVRYAQVPTPALLWWILSYGGHLEVLQPSSLRERVREAGLRLAECHAPVPDGSRVETG